MEYPPGHARYQPTALDNAFHALTVEYQQRLSELVKDHEAQYEEALQLLLARVKRRVEGRSDG